MARNTGFLANVYLDCEKDELRVVRLRPVDTTADRHILAVPKGTVVVSSFFLDHGTWYLNNRTVEVVGAETTVRYEPGDFGF
jgi:hypothetical protein